MCLVIDDEVIRSATVVKDGEVTWPPPPVSVSAAPKQAPVAASPDATAAVEKSFGVLDAVLLVVGALLLVGIAMTRDQGFITDFTLVKKNQSVTLIFSPQ